MRMITDIQKTAFLEQLKKTPIVQVACEKTTLSRASYYRLRKEDENFKKQADEALLEGSLLVNDLAESQLITAIKDRNLTAIQLWLKTHHPQYANRLEVQGKVTVENEPLSNEQQELIKKALSLVGIIPNPKIYEDTKSAI